MKFKIGERIVHDKDPKVAGIITNYHSITYYIEWDTGLSHWSYIEQVDKSFVLEEIYFSPLYQALT